jgi:hypothetical protein
VIDRETWLLDEGDRVIRAEAENGAVSLPPRDRLIHSLWVADYGMRNAGDLDTAADVHPAFLAEGLAAATALGMPRATAAFSLPPGELEGRWFNLFDGLVNELRRTPVDNPTGSTAYP